MRTRSKARCSRPQRYDEQRPEITIGMRGKLSKRAALSLGILVSGVMVQAELASKRGMSYIGDADSHDADYDILLSSGSPINWYFTWSPITAPAGIFPDGTESRVEFVPALPAIDNLDDNIDVLDRVPSSSKHLFTFNEPDGTTNSGGSNISPDDAAKAYIEKIVPLRDRFQISHPSVTGSQRGLEWLNDFNSSCWEINSDNGCPADFVTAHWYGEFAGLSSWLDQLTEWYSHSGSGLEKDLKVWVKELGLPQADQDTTFAMMNQTLPYLDQLEYVEKYAWFGTFRPKEANEWTGDGLALFQSDGGLSELGSYYLGGEANGFKVGQQGESSDGSGNNGGNDNNDAGDYDDESGNANDLAGLRASLLALCVMTIMACFLNL
ncbi:glycosyl hydrolase catalytic core-domain-containing protein [Xylaria digitata]|nr:glycosyl hydrolase catalytic core-domain-containing protein [Xylaria digitata]